MNSTKVKNRLLLSACIIILITLSVVANLCSIPNTYAQSDNMIANLTEEQYSITNTDEPNGIKLKRYALDYYGKNTPLSWVKNKKITITDNDDIIKIIPEQLFRQVGIVQHIGREYGFFIETRKPFADNDMLLSTVIILDVNNTNDMTAEKTKTHLKIKITPIFQADFAYIERGNNKIYHLDKQDYAYFKEKYVEDLEVEFPTWGNGFVIPIPTLYVSSIWLNLDFLQHNKYYLTNASNTTSLYNVNHLNPYDEGYIAQQDPGCFFSQLDFNYDGFFLERGKTSAEEVGTVVYNAASLAFDVYDNVKGLKSVFKAVPYIGAVVTVADTVKTIMEISEAFKYHNVTNKKEITYTPLYNSRDLQLRNGGLQKDQTIAIQSATEKQLLFATNDYFEFDYQINCDDITVDTRYATMITIGVMSVVNTSASSTKFGEIHESTSIYSKELIINPDKNYKEIPKAQIVDISKEAKMNVLPNNRSIIQLSPTYTGTYDISVANPYAKYEIYEVPKLDNGLLDYKDTSKLVCRSQMIDGIAKGRGIYLYSNRNYVLFADLQNNIEVDRIYGRYGIVDLHIEFLPTILTKGGQDQETIQPNDTVVFEYDSLSVDVLEYNIQSGHELEIEIGRNMLHDSFYRSSGTDIFGSLIIDGGKQYIKIRNNTDVAQFVTVSIKETEHLKTQEVNSFDVRYTKAFVVSLPYTMDVTLTLNSEKAMYMEIYNNENQLVTKSMDGHIRELYFTILSNQKYFVIVKQLFGTSLSASLTFKYNIGNLKPVYNYFNKVEKDSILLYHNEDFVGDFIIGTDLDFEVYDDQYAILSANADGSYTLNKNIGYYFQIKESGNQCNIDFNLVSTTSTSGVFPDSGVVYIKYTTSESGEYSVKGADSYFWLTENLEKRYGKLNANETYYLMLEGKAAEVYNINIEHVEVQRTQLPLTMGVERNAGQYYFIIEKQGNYTFKTFRNSDIVSSDLSIYDENGKEYCKNLCTDLNTLELTLSPGKYYLDLNVEPATDTVTIRINKKR